MPHVGGDEPGLSSVPCLQRRMPHVGGDEPVAAIPGTPLAQYAPRRWG